MHKPHMNRTLRVAVVVSFALAGCKTSNEVQITAEQPVSVVKPRSEPIFYNGKTYKLDFGPIGATTTYQMTVSGMSVSQKKDAVAVATSSLAYFACPDGQRGKLQNEPAYVGAKWNMQARCG